MGVPEELALPLVLRVDTGLCVSSAGDAVSGPLAEAKPLVEGVSELSADAEGEPVPVGVAGALPLCAPLLAVASVEPVALGVS